MATSLALILTAAQVVAGYDWNAAASQVRPTTPRSPRGSTLVSWNHLPRSDHCTKEDGREGRCVQSYLCLDRGERINDDGTDLTDERTLQCQLPAVCCPVSEKLLETTSTKKPSTLVPGVVTKPTGPGQACEAFDHSSGRCLYPHLCTNDTTVVDGSDLVDERTIDPCPAWQGAIQICCPESFWKGKIDEDEFKVTTPTSKTGEDKDEVCTTKSLEAGQCVPFYQCNRDDDYDGADILNVRYTVVVECGYAKTCCPTANVDRTKTPPTPPPPTKCGVANPDGLVYRNITGNTNEAKYGEFPWMVAVRTRTGPGVASFNTTGGSVIHPWIVLTAAHYVARAVDADVRVRAGEWDTLTTDEPLKYQERNVRKVLLHPEFNNRNKHNDIALLFLTTAFSQAPHVGVVCLPPQGQRVQPSTDCIANGWISSERRMAANDDVRAGEWDTLTTDEPLKYQERNVRKVLLHPEFNNRNKHNDIALLFLTTAFTQAPHVGVVCLPPQGQRAQPSTDCIANGWGKDKFGKKGRLQNILKKTTLPVMALDECQGRLRNTRLGPFYKLHPGFMCAGGEKLDTCTQDGGGPLACPTLNDPNQYVQHGIVSWGIGCGQDGVPGVYVDVGQYRNWIDQEIAKEGYKLDTN